MIGDIAGSARSLGDRFKRAPAKVRIATAAGVLALLAVVGTVVITGALSGPDGAGAAPGPSTGPSAGGKALYSGVKKYSGRGMSLNVPDGWKKTAVNTYVDFNDPENQVRRVRLNVESAGGDSTDFFRVAEGRLKGGTDSCPAYKHVDLRDVTVAGRAGSELEYTCGEGDAQRHGLWSAVVQGGKAYQFSLSVPEPDFADSKVIYQEMARSFTLTTS
jgi:hypothetical protein